MSVQGNQNLSGVTINSKVSNRTADYDPYDDTPFPTGDTGQEINFGIEYYNTNYYINTSGAITGFCDASIFVANDPTFDNAPLLEGVLSSGGYAQFGTGTYYFSRPISTGITGPLRYARIGGLVGDNAFQLREIGGGQYRGGTVLAFQNTGIGEICIDFPVTNYSTDNPSGPYVLENLYISGYSNASLLRFGRAGIVTADQPLIRSVILENVGLSSYRLDATGAITGASGNFGINRSIVDNYCLSMYNVYDTELHNVVCRGAYRGVYVYKSDFLDIDGLHLAHQAYGLQTVGTNSVPGSIRRVFCEGQSLCSVQLEHGMLTDSRVENGYAWLNQGEFQLPAGITFSIGANTSICALTGLPAGRMATDYIETGLPFRIVDAAKNRTYWLLPSGIVGNNVYIDNTYGYSNFNRNVTGSNLYSYFGFGFGLNTVGRTSIDNCSFDYNTAQPNLPIGYVHTQFNNTKIGTIIDESVSNMDETNQIVSIGHTAGGTQFAMKPTLFYDSPSALLAPRKSPFTDIRTSSYHNNYAGSSVWVNHPDMNIPNKKWVFYPGYGLTAASSIGKSIDCFYESGRIIEDWGNLSTAYRDCVLTNFDPTGTNIRFQYTLYARCSSGSSATVNVVECNYSTWLGNRTSFSIPNTWTKITGQFTTTGATQARKDNYSIAFNTATPVLCEKIVLESLYNGE